MSGYAPLGPDVIGRLTMNTDPWLSCDECFEQVDAVIEDLLNSSAPMSHEFGVHLRCCGVCHEEARSLAAIVASDYGLTSSQAVELLDAAVENQPT